MLSLFSTGQGKVSPKDIVLNRRKAETSSNGYDWFLCQEADLKVDESPSVLHTVALPSATVYSDWYILKKAEEYRAQKRKEDLAAHFL